MTAHMLIVSQAYDSHCNLVLGEVEETIYVFEDEEESENVRTIKKQSEMLFVRGMLKHIYVLGSSD